MTAREPPIGGGDRRRLWRRWTVAAFLGETLGFLVPVVAAVVVGDGDGEAAPRFLALVVAGAGEGAVLGAAQGRVLGRVLPGFSRTAWTSRTALAAALAWAIGLAPSELADAWGQWPTGAQLAVAVPAGAVLLASIGTAQWTVLRRFVPRAIRWIGWTALAWLAGLAVFMIVATPLWRPGQPMWLIAGIGALAGGLMALTMAVVSGWGLVSLLRPAPPGTGSDGQRRTRTGPSALTGPMADSPSLGP